MKKIYTTFIVLISFSINAQSDTICNPHDNLKYVIHTNIAKDQSISINSIVMNYTKLNRFVYCGSKWSYNVLLTVLKYPISLFVRYCAIFGSIISTLNFSRIPACIIDNIVAKRTVVDMLHSYTTKYIQLQPVTTQHVVENI